MVTEIIQIFIQLSFSEKLTLPVSISIIVQPSAHISDL
jgi:hypothetical protein